MRAICSSFMEEKMLRLRGHSWLAHAACVLVAMVMLLGPASGRVSAQELPQAVPEPRAYFVIVSPPDIHNLDIPRFKDMEEADKFSAKVMMERVLQLNGELVKLQEAGLIQNFELVNNGQYYRIEGVDPAAFPMIERLEIVDAIIDDTGGDLACLANKVETLPNRLWDMSRVQIAHETSLIETDLDASPIIEIYQSSYEDWWNINTIVTPNTEVKLEIWRGGNLVAYDYSLSGNTGYVYFSPDYISCPSGHFSWNLITGDTVKIIDSGQTYQTVYAPISGWANPDTNIVFGTTLPWRTVAINFWMTPLTNYCETLDTTVHTASGDSGSFSINTSSQIDFTQNTSVTIYSIDSSGNYTYTNARVFSINIWAEYSGIDFRHMPNMDFTGTLTRDASIISSVSGQTDDEGYGWGEFSAPTQVGDVFNLTVGSDTFVRTVESRSFPEITSFDPETGVLTGIGIPGEKIFIEVYPSSDSAIVKCNYFYQCEGIIIPESGLFTINIGPVSPGQGVDLIKVLQDGRIIGKFVFYEPVINANPQYNRVIFDDVYWGDDPIVTLKDSLGGIKHSLIASRYFYGYTYYAQFNADMIAGDRIEITDGHRTDVMVVGDLRNLRLNYNTNILTGQGTGQKVMAQINGSNGDSYSYCSEHDLGSETNFALAVPVVNAAYQAYVELYGADGNVTSGYAYSLDLNVWVNNSTLIGVAETPGVTVNWELWRSENKIYEGNTSLGPTIDFFYVWLGTPPLTGDTLVVTTSDGNSASIVYPVLNATADFSTRTVSGKSIPNRSGWINFYGQTPDRYFSYNVSNFADSGGSYLVHLPQEMYWSEDCVPVNPAYPCVTLGNYSWDMENFLIINGPGYPNPIAADVYEMDDTKENASGISGLQSHTIHTDNDLDWVKFTVSQEDVDHGHPFLFKTYGLGWDFDLVMELLAQDGMTLLDIIEDENWDGSGLGPEMQHIFTEPGTYYLRLHSMGTDWDGGYCDSKYSLLVIKDPQYVFLPLIKR